MKWIFAIRCLQKQGHATRAGRVAIMEAKRAVAQPTCGMPGTDRRARSAGCVALISGSTSGRTMSCSSVSQSPGCWKFTGDGVKPTWSTACGQSTRRQTGQDSNRVSAGCVDVVGPQEVVDVHAAVLADEERAPSEKEVVGVAEFLGVGGVAPARRQRRDPRRSAAPCPPAPRRCPIAAPSLRSGCPRD